VGKVIHTEVDRKNRKKSLTAYLLVSILMPMDDTKNKIMDLAENLLLSRGYNGFSYKDISLALGIKNATVHYHYPAKKDLGVAVIRRARDQLKTELRM